MIFMPDRRTLDEQHTTGESTGTAHSNSQALNWETINVRVRTILDQQRLALSILFSRRQSNNHQSGYRQP